MPLAEQVIAFMEQAATVKQPPIEKLMPEEARRAYLELNRFFEYDGPKLADIQDRMIPVDSDYEIPIRIYRKSDKENQPIIIYYHGGGWVIGSIETHDALCRWLTLYSDCIVVSVEYRLAPEFPYPTAVHDAYAAAKWIHKHAHELGGNPEKIAVAGDSAGATLATVVCMKAKKHQDLNFVSQILYYPTIEFTFDTDSYKQFAEGYMLTKERMKWFANHYFQKDLEKAKHPEASPILAEDVSGQPPAFIITAEYDPLRDEGEAYAEKLKNAGVEVVCKRYAGMIHGFIRAASIIDKGKEAIVETSEFLKKYL